MAKYCSVCTGCHQLSKPGISQTKFLFSHFSQEIASVMVALDTNLNGYCTVILPSACQHSEVRTAVCIISALHLGMKMPELRAQAKNGRVAMITRLRPLADLEDWREIFSPSHQMVILLLLVGEMITGSDDFSYLIKMLLSLSKSNGQHHTSRSEVHAFLHQIQMIELFAGPFLGEFENIVFALQMLRKLWDYQSHGRWTGILPNLSALVM